MQNVDFNAELIKKLNNAATIEFQTLCNLLTAEINQYKGAWHYRYRVRVWERDNGRPKHPRLIDVEQLENILNNTTLSSTLLQSLSAYLNNSANFRFAKLSPLRIRLNQAIKNYRTSHNIKLIDEHLQLLQMKSPADVEIDGMSEVQSEDTERVESVSVNELDEKLAWQAQQIEGLRNERDILHRQLGETELTVSKLKSVQAETQRYQHELATTQAHYNQIQQQLTSRDLQLNAANSSIEKNLTDLAAKDERLRQQLQQEQFLTTALEQSQQALEQSQQSFKENLVKMQHLESMQLEWMRQERELRDTIEAMREKLDHTAQKLESTKKLLEDQVLLSTENENKRQIVERQLSDSVNRLADANEQLQEQVKAKDAIIAQQSQCIQDQHDYQIFLNKAYANYQKSAADLIHAFTQVLSSVIQLFKQVLQPQLGKKLRNEIRNQVQSKTGKYAILLLKQQDHEKEANIETAYKKYIVEDDVMQRVLDAGSETVLLSGENANEGNSAPTTPKKTTRSSVDNLSLVDHPNSLVAQMGSPEKNFIVTPDNRVRLKKSQRLNPAYIGKSNLSESAVDVVYQARFSSLMNHH